MPHTLLLADDSVTIQRVIELTFADEDIRVVAVSDGKQAVRQLQEHTPDIVLADVGMPEMDGYEVAAFVKRTPGLSHVPVLLLTGAFEPVDDRRAREVGCDGVLVKPFEPQMVISRVKDLIAGRPAAAAIPRMDALSNPPVFTAPPPATDEYFERLDAALSSFDSSAALPQAVPAGAPDGRTAAADDTPTLAMPFPPPAPPSAPEADTSVSQPVPQIRPAPEPPAAPVAIPAAAPPHAVAPATPEPAVTDPSSSPFAEAFEALLAAEQGRPMDSTAARTLASGDTLVDHITRQVIERLADERMREVVLDVAERLVREEIDRIKSAAS